MAYKRGNAGKTRLDLAQEEWERKMRMVFRQKDIKEDPEIPEEIGCLIKKRNEKRQAKRIKLTKEIRRQGPLKHILYQYPARTDAGEGMRFARDNVEPFVGKTADISRWGIALYMLAGLRADSSFNESYERAMEIKDSDGKRIFHKANMKRLSMKDIGQIRKEGLKAIKEMGIADIKTSNPVLILIKLKKLSIQGKIDTKEAKAVYEVLRKTVKLEAMKGRQPPRLTRFTLRKVGNELEKDDTGKEIVKTMRTAKKGRRLIRKMIRLTKEEYYNPKIIVRENRIRALNEEINRIGSVPGQDINIKSVPGKEPAVPQREHSFLRNFFKKREGATLPAGKEAKSAKGITKRFVKKAGSRFKKARRIIGSGPGLFKILIPVTGFLLFIAVVLILVLGTAAAIADAVSFDTKSDKVKDLCFQCIKECYEEQINIISNYNSGGYYSNVVIKEMDLKSNEAYDSDLAYTETTNITEMLSMATIYFEGDLSSAAEEELVAYLKGLYHGSHVISASDDGSGTVTLTVTTYYFDDLFDVAVSDWQSNGSVISGTRIDIPQSFTQVMTYEPFNYENLTGEHYWNYACRNMWKNWTEQGQKADEGLCYIEAGGTKFYLVAVYEPTFGKVGDYIDFYFPDSDYVMHCIIADTKGADEALFRAGDGKIYGHRTGPSSCSVIEFMLKYQSRGSAGSFTHGYGGPGHAGWHPEMGGNALYAVNGGSYFASPQGPVFTYASDSVSASSGEYLEKLSGISSLIKSHAGLFTRGRGKNCSYREMVKRVNAGKGGIYIDCGTPSSWALQSMGLVSNSVYIKGGKMSGGAKALIRTGKVRKTVEAAGKTIRDASNAGLLKPGDILLCGGAADHTVTYVGKDENGHPLCYEGGGYANGKGYAHVGCGPLDYSTQTQYRIRIVLRWR